MQMPKVTNKITIFLNLAIWGDHWIKKVGVGARSKKMKHFLAGGREKKLL